MSACCKCKNKSKTFFPCDSCKRDVCKPCTNLDDSELKCMTLRNRKLLFVCEDCKKGFAQIPIMLKEFEELKQEMSTLKMQIESHKLNQNPSVRNENEFTLEEFINEMEDRKSRACNVIITNIKEANGNNQKERIEEDNDSVKNILQKIDANFNETFKIQRLGKYDKKRNRLIKVCFESAEIALKILKNKKNLDTTAIKIFGDKTKKQTEYYRKLKQELEEIEKAGDKTKRILYVNNIPKIVTKRENDHF